LQLELFFAGWRKAAVSAKLENQRLQQQEQQEPGLTAVSADLSSGEAAASRSPGVTWQDKMDSEAPPGPDGLQCSNRPAPAAGQLSSTDAPVEQQHQHQQENQDLEGDSQACEGCQQDAKVNVSLADSLVGHTWRPLLQRKAVMAPQGLARLTGLRLGRAVRDLRELEGGFILKDSSRCNLWLNTMLSTCSVQAVHVVAKLYSLSSQATTCVSLCLLLCRRPQWS
jgi:hypothetical protein